MSNPADHFQSKSKITLANDWQMAPKATAKISRANKSKPPPIPDEGLPPVFAVSQLKKKNPHYHEALIQRINNFYEGGRHFADHRKEYLIKRQADQDEAYSASRLSCATYSNELAHQVGKKVECILKDPPRIKVADGKGDDPRAAYWIGLNTAIDGVNESIDSLCYSRLTQMFLHPRSYLTMDWPDVEKPDGETLAQAKAPQTDGDGNKTGPARLDIGICYQDARDVDDWKGSHYTDLKWVRTHTISQHRSKEFGPVDIERHTWTFFTRDQIVPYVAEREFDIESGKAKDWETNAIAKRDDSGVVEHGLGYLPISEIHIPAGLAMGERIIESCQKLFNLQAALDFALYAGAINKACIRGESRPDQIDWKETGCLFLGPNGDFFWAAPPAQVFASMGTAISDCRSDITREVNSIGDEALKTHQSGVAKSGEKSGNEALLWVMRNALVHELQRIIDRIAIIRGETDLKPQVCGMEHMGDQAAEMEAVTTQMVLTTMPMPVKAKQLMLKRFLRTTLDLTQDQWVEVDKQIDAMTEEDFLPPAPPMPAGGMQDGKTGKPKGFGTDAVKASATTPKGNAA